MVAEIGSVKVDSYSPPTRPYDRYELEQGTDCIGTSGGNE